jgi:peroxiredoxin
MTAQDTSVQSSIQRGQTIPDFTLPDHTGETVSSRSYYIHRNLVVALLPEDVDAQWGSWLEGVAKARAAVEPTDAQFLLIAPSMNDTLRDFADRSANRYLRVLVDTDGEITEKFGHDTAYGQLLIADRYGVVFQAGAGNASDEAIAPESIPGWVEFVYCRCS